MIRDIEKGFDPRLEKLRYEKMAALRIFTVQEAGSRLQLHLEVGTHER